MKPYSTDDSNIPSRTKPFAAQKTFLWYQWLFSVALCASPMVSLPARAQSQWTTTDAFQLVQGFSSEGLGLGTNEFGNVITVGHGITDGSGTTVAITRESQDQGQTWPSQLSRAFIGLCASSLLE